MWDQAWGVVGQIATSVVVALIAVVKLLPYFAKKHIDHEFATALATHKAELKERGDIAAIRMNRLYERKLEIYAVTFAKLTELEVLVGDYVSYWGDLGKEREEKRQRFATVFDDFQKEFLANRIFVPEQLADEINDFRQRLHKVVLDFMLEVEGLKGDRPPAPVKRKDGKDPWQAAIETANEEIPELRRKLESLFRKELGE